jgi:predicted RND superfamily exporter protein
MKKNLPYILAIILTGFGLLTLFLSTSVIFDLFGIRAKEGNYVLFVVWSNFISSILYLISSYGFVTSKRWTAKLLGVSAIILFIALIGLFYHINSGGIYETKTIGAMIFRISVTTAFAALAYFTNTKRNK